MSYYTDFQLLLDGDLVEPEILLASAKAYLTEQNCYAVDDVLRGISVALKDGKVLMQLYREDLEGLFGYLAKQFPQTTFLTRGMGEEFEDVWLRKYAGAEIAMSKGPFEAE